MPVDTVTKRASLLHIVLPDAAIDAGDRLTLVQLYSGIAADAPVAETSNFSPMSISLGLWNAVTKWWRSR